MRVAVVDQVQGAWARVVNVITWHERLVHIRRDASLWKR